MEVHRAFFYSLFDSFMLILLYFLHCLLHIYEYMKSTLKSNVGYRRCPRSACIVLVRIILYYYHNKIPPPCWCLLLLLRGVSTTMNSSLLSSTDPAGGHPVPLAGWQTAKASVRSEGSLRSGGLARSVNIAGPA